MNTKLMKKRCRGKKNLMVISNDVKKIGKIHHTFMIKILKKLEIEWKHPNIIKPCKGN